MYFITTIEKIDMKTKLQEGSRCVGYFSELNDAVECLKDNCCDLNEAGLYPWAVIENIPEGLYQYDLNPLWFKWDDVNEKYIKVDTPEELKNICGWGVG